MSRVLNELLSLRKYMSECNFYYEVSQDDVLVIDNALEEIERLRKALEFYGNPSTYHTLTRNFGMLILQDEGIRARRALQGREPLE